jgi:hypothetical protein
MILGQPFQHLATEDDGTISTARADEARRGPREYMQLLEKMRMMSSLTEIKDIRTFLV